MSEAALNLQFGTEEAFKLKVRTSYGAPMAAPEAKVAATLLPAMQEDEGIRVERPLDPVFAENLMTIQDIYATWYSEAERITVRSPEGDPPNTASGDLTAAFFTGGVDSFYTLLKHEDEIDALVFVHGFDVALEDNSLRGRVSETIQKVGSHFGKDVIEVETNLKDFSNDHVSWERYHGAALATVALTLQKSIEKTFIASSLPYDNLKPWGTSPLLDPLWSTRQIEFDHDGCEAKRVEKCERLNENDMALETLRVCWQNRSGAYNCGRCEKCVRTMVQLLAAGALDRCTTFAEPLDPSRIKDFPAVRQKSYRYLPPLRQLEEDDRAPEVRNGIRKGLEGPSMTKRTKEAASAQYQAILHRIGDLLRTMGLFIWKAKKMWVR